METVLYSTFLDDKEIACRIFDMLANDVLGQEQLEKIRLRYYDMYYNFFNYSRDEVEKMAKIGVKASVWEFSKGLEPFKPKGWNHYYGDTITIPIPITHTNFIDLTMREKKRGAIGLDLPVWFNLRGNSKRIMLVAQDPLRGNVWYSDIEEFPDGKKGCKEDYICIDALVATPFGLHNRSWRENKRGGGRMRLLVEKLIESNYGVYLTDCRKYFVYDHKESAIYSASKIELYRNILRKEIEIINPTCIVAMGNQAYDYCVELLENSNRLHYVPHFSGAATWRAKKEFGIQNKVSIEELAQIYAEKIIEFSQVVVKQENK